MTLSAPTTKSDILACIAAELRQRQRVLITSHLRPDGDAIGCELAMACALRALGKQVRVVNADPPPETLASFPGVGDIEIADHADGDVDAVVVMECGDLSRTGVTGLEGRFIINIDHHTGNTLYGAVNWFDQTAAACGEMVFDVIQALGVPLSYEMAVHLYVAILTDTGSFHHSSISPRTFDICRRALEAGVDPVAVSRTVYDSNTVGRMRLTGTLLGAVEVEAAGRLAVLYLDRAIARATGGSYDDTEGLINVPLTVKEIQAVAFFKESQAGEFRVSLRSKGDVDVRQVALGFGGGGHKNAAGFTVHGDIASARGQVLPLVIAAIEGRACAPTSPGA